MTKPPSELSACSVVYDCVGRTRVRIALTFLGIAALAALGVSGLAPPLGIYEDACFDPEQVEPRTRPTESVWCFHPDAKIKAQREAQHLLFLTESDRLVAERHTLEGAADECRWEARRCDPRTRCWNCGGLDRIWSDLLACARRRGGSEPWQRQASVLESEVRRLERAEHAVGSRQAALGELGVCEY